MVFGQSGAHHLRQSGLTSASNATVQCKERIRECSYRALWSEDSQEDPHGYLAEARAKFSHWAMENSDAEPLSAVDSTTEVTGIYAKQR